MSSLTKMQSRMIHYFSICEDPRKHRIRHNLIDIILITILSIVCGEEGWESFHEWAKDKRG